MLVATGYLHRHGTVGTDCNFPFVVTLLLPDQQVRQLFMFVRPMMFAVMSFEAEMFCTGCSVSANLATEEMVLSFSFFGVFKYLSSLITLTQTLSSRYVDPSGNVSLWFAHNTSLTYPNGSLIKASCFFTGFDCKTTVLVADRCSMWPFTSTSCPGATSEMSPIDKVLDSWLLYSKLTAVSDSNVFLLITISSHSYLVLMLYR